ncbi:hypothetical protein Trydic_g2998 [Trypoxylus dichotomus]
MAEELNALFVNKTRKQLHLPEEKKPIAYRWVFKIKGRSDEGNFRYRARLVAKGYSQVPGLDYEGTFGPVARWDTIRSVLSVTAKENLNIAQFDVKTAFLYANIEDDLYMSQPEGSYDKSGRVSIVSRPDLTFTINYLSQALEEPIIKHWNMVKRVLRYLRGTTELGILYDSSSDGELEAFSDAEYAGDVSTRNSTSEMIFKYCGGAIAWPTLKQLLYSSDD